MSNKASRIVVVEDEKSTLRLIEKWLAGSDYEVLTATDAESGLDTFLDNTDIDLVILDIYLPDHSGVKLLMRIKSMECFNKTPVLVLSSSIEPNHYVDTLIFENVFWEPKPIKSGQYLIKKIESIWDNCS